MFHQGDDDGVEYVRLRRCCLPARELQEREIAQIRKRPVCPAA
jgi:hypothetical protein